MNTSMRPIAAGLASLGRNNDSMLVHMTPGEVHGLQRLALAHGGSLTINPHTGLPEAGFLSSILPMVAGVGLSAISGGTLSPLAIGLITGGLGALTTGSLSKGLMAGLGAYGGAGLGGALAGLAPEAQPIVSEMLSNNFVGDLPLAQSAASALPSTLPSMNPSVMGDYGRSLAMDFANPAERFFVPGMEPLNNVAAAIPPAPAPVPVPPASPYVGDLPLGDTGNLVTSGKLPLSQWERMQIGAGRLVDEPGTAFKELLGTAANKKDGTEKTGLGGWGGAATTAGMALAPALAYGATQLAQQPTLRGVPPGGIAGIYSGGAGSKYGFSQGQVNPRFGLPGEPYFLDRGFTSYAAGGSIPPMATNYPQSNITPSTYATSPQSPLPSEVFDEYGPRINPFTGEQRMAAGGIASLHEYAAGGRLLDGPGDGMSDSIPAVIKGPKPQRAALADGEFVIPSDVVSHLGNGSTKAGAKRLYDMMDRVRTARVGTKKQGKQINPNKFMPA